jgi:hypothetical protein
MENGKGKPETGEGKITALGLEFSVSLFLSPFTKL